MSFSQPLTRRSLFQATALLGSATLMPAAFATLTPSVLESGLWSAKALPLGQHAAGAVKRHAFITEACSGALAKPAFVAYMTLNIAYLTDYARSLDMLASRVGAFADLKTESEALRTWAKETVGVKDWCIDLYQQIAKRNYNAKRVPSFPAGVDYAKFERMYVLKYDVAVGMAALLPCFWIYEEIGGHIAKLRQTQGNAYSEWLESFGTQASHEAALKAVALADKLAARADDTVRRQMTDVFVAGCWKEFACFDAAYRTLFRNL
ncbi:MAG: hypothetical protein Q4E62_05050 [Sutterellaceae bacterium]|nr:hypothetical protein [Sutterellaceae bacterium]